MKILLIQPKMNKRPVDTNLKTQMAPSLALLTLMALTPSGHETVLVNENVEKIDYSCAADLVGITVTLDVLPRAAGIATEFRRRGVPVVAGGIHVTCSPDSCRPHFDAICVGPAERVWGSIVTDAAAGCLKAMYKDMDGFRGDEIASPLYAGVDRRKYLYTNVLTTSRGCPNRCDFCYNSCDNRIYVQRPVDAVLRDIESLGTRHVLFIDDNFIGVPDYTRRLLERLKGRNLIWSAAVTTRILDLPDLLDLMAETGCQSLFIGFESISAASLQSVCKDNDSDTYRQLVDAIHSRGIMVNASMVFGLDGDGPDTFRRTLDWLVKTRIETLTSHILTPYPGTALHRRMEAAGRITDHNLAHYNTANVVFTPAGMTPDALFRGYLRMYRQFYSLRNIIRRYPRHKAQRKAYLLFNLLYRKFGCLTAALTRLVPIQVIGRLAARISYKI